MINQITGAGQSSQTVALNHLSDSTSNRYSLGPIMKVKNFRLNIVFGSSVSVLWALVYVPEGMPIGTLSYGQTSAANVPTSLYEPQQFLIASGLTRSAAVNSGANAGPLRVWPISQESQSGRWGLLDLAISRERQGVETFITISYACCVN